MRLHWNTTTDTKLMKQARLKASIACTAILKRGVGNRRRYNSRTAVLTAKTVRL